MLARRRWRRVVVLAGMLLASPSIRALNPAFDLGQYAHTAWRVREGFTRSGINAVAQTSDGYLWLGTEFGLLRFDGVRTVPWEPPGQHLPSNYIFSLLATRDGALWIGTWTGLARWKDGRLTQYTELAGHYVLKLLEDRSGVVWAGARSSGDLGILCAIQLDSVHCDGKDGGIGRGLDGLYEDHKGNLWVGVPNGVWHWKPGNPKFYPLSGGQDCVCALGETTDGKLLIGWNGGIQQFVDGKFTPYELGGKPPYFRAKRILRDRDGSLWIGTSHRGLLHAHQGTTDTYASADGLSGDDVESLLEDREGSIWVATIDGLDRFRDVAVAIFSVKHGLSTPDASGSIVSLPDGSVWFNAYGGLNRRAGLDVSRVPVEGLPDRGVRSLFADDHGRLWISTVRGVGYLEKGRFSPIHGAPQHVIAMAQDRTGNLWAADDQLGLVQLSEQNKFRQVLAPSLGDAHLSALAGGSSGSGVWIGYQTGGVSYVEDGRVRASYSPADGLGEGEVSGFQYDHEGTLWISTAGGLSRFKNGRLATLTSKSGLPCDSVHWVMEDDQHSLWLYMPCGLVRITRSELDAWAAGLDNNKAAKAVQTTLFDSSDGVRNVAKLAHESPHVAKSRDGKLWFLAWDGLNVLDPLHVPFNELPPPVHIEQVVAERTPYAPPAAGQKRLGVPSRIRDLQIDYTALSLVAPEKVRFRYKLEGYDPEWQDVGNRRQAFYTNLPPREYHFRVTASNNSGVWSETGAVIDFTVAPAYYQTMWFRLASLGVVALLLSALYRLRLAQLARQYNIRVEERVSERTRLARDLHDTLLQSFQGSLFEFQAARNLLSRRPADAMKSLDDAIHSAEAAIVEGRDAIQDMRSGLTGQSDLAHMLTAAAQELAQAQALNGRAPLFHATVEGEPQALSPGIQDEVYRIGREILRNAFRHARAERIEMEIRYAERMLRLRIRDDGIGIDPNVLNEGTRPGHWGLPGMRERAKLVGAQLDFWSESGAGTEVQLTVPAFVAYLKSDESHVSKLLRNLRRPDGRRLRQDSNPDRR